ncbi:MAG: c-type cytochrome [Gammaproteobacteria bacterium]|nr:c-type cytochrome [Gammaproteobacteria bacterium]MBI5615288.1 c-type cytochrome [Gammaproteobacteria bacterium]
MIKNAQLVLAACALSSVFVLPVHAAGNADAGKTKSAACGACHGADGNSVAPTFPKLAGQVPEYIIKQLHDFKAGRRSNPVMSPMAQPLSDQDIEDVAAYFSSQKLAPPAATAAAVPTGEKIYLKGKGLPTQAAACLGCHGQGGEGNINWKKNMAVQPAVLAPAIGGQHSGYVAAQLQAFQAAQRANDVGSIMRNVAHPLNAEEIQAVADYVATLTR